MKGWRRGMSGDGEEGPEPMTISNSRIGQKIRPAWSVFLETYDRRGLLTPRQRATIRQLYEALRLCGYDPKCRT
jgi:hypothetical protein